MKRTQKQEAPKRRKRAYELRQKGKSWKEVASVMECSVDAVQSLERRFREENNIPSHAHPQVQAFRRLPVSEMTRRLKVYGQHSVTRMERQKAAWLLREKGLSWKEIAESMDTTSSGAYALATSFTPKKLRALSTLKRTIRERQLRRMKLGQRVMKLRVAGKTWSQVEAQVGIHRSSAQRYYAYVVNLST